MEISYPQWFPHSNRIPFIKTSEQTRTYNCIAWVFGDTTRFYWPTTHPHHFWPANVPFEETIEAFIKLYNLIDYECCDTGVLEEGFEKIVIYTKDGIPTHAARQLDSGLWSSKLGPLEDVSHTLESISEGVYGEVTQFMKRLIPNQILHLTRLTP